MTRIHHHTPPPTPPLYNFDAMQFRIENARAAFTDPKRLEGAFIWEKTPQGEEYWRGQSAGLDDEGWATLAYMIAQSAELLIIGEMRRAA